VDCSDELLRTIYLDGIQDSQVDSVCLQGNIGDIHAMVTVLPAIRALAIGGVQLSVADMQVLAAGLRTSQQLEVLFFWDCPLTDEHIRIFNTEFLTHPAIRRDTEENNDTSFDLVLQNVIESPSAAQSLIRATLTPSACKTLNLSNNPNIGYDGLRLIGEALPNSKISELLLNGVSEWVAYDDDDEELAETQKLKCNLAAEALVQGVRNNVNLQVLNIEGLNLPSKAVDEIDFYLKLNSTFGRHLLSKQQSLPLSIWSILLAGFNDKISVVFFYVRELPMLVASGR
jgi:hypothetical protein